MWPVATILSSTALEFRVISPLLIAINCMTPGKLLNTFDPLFFSLYETGIMNSPFLFIFSPEKLTIGDMPLKGSFGASYGF